MHFGVGDLREVGVGFGDGDLVAALRRVVVVREAVFEFCPGGGVWWPEVCSENGLWWSILGDDEKYGPSVC